MSRWIAVALAVSLLPAAARAEWKESNTYRRCNAVSFVDSNLGFAIQDELLSKNLLKTTDGGLTWTKVTNTGLDMTYAGDMKFLDSKVGYVVAGSAGVTWSTALYKTTDGGATWAAKTLPEVGSGNTGPWLQHVAFATLNDGLVGGAPYPNYQATVYATHDGGDTWTALTLPVTSSGSGIVGLAALGAQHFVVAFSESSGSVRSTYLSKDGGGTWTKAGDFGGELDFVSATVGFLYQGNAGPAAVENNVVLKTTDGGATWSSPANAYREGASRMAWADEDNGILVGSKSGKPLVLRTSDGGKTFTEETLPSGVASASDLLIHPAYSGKSAFAGANGFNGSKWIANTGLSAKEKPALVGAPPPAQPDAGTGGGSNDGGGGGNNGGGGGCSTVGATPIIVLALATAGGLALLRRRRG